MKRIILICLLVSVIFVSGCIQENAICPTDTKICSDGSMVVRVGPNCEFEPCPTCSNNSNCIFTYAGDNACAACDFSDPDYKCVSPDEVERLKAIHDSKYGQVACAPCPTSPKYFHCVCENGSCVKTSTCDDDSDCYSFSFRSAYKCIDNECIYSE